MFVDAHCHLDDAQFVGDLDGVLDRAAAAGVAAVITAGVDVESCRAAVALAQRDERVYAAVGLHPHHADALDEQALSALGALAREPRVVAIGEIGLDLHYADGAPLPVQLRNLEAWLDLADELDKPVILHDREAHRPMMEALRRRGRRPGGRPGMLHCFSGDLEMAREAIALGYKISFAGNITFSKAHDLAAVAAVLPLEEVLIETDAPYLSPAPRRGRRNEPAQVVAVGERLATLRGVDLSVIEQATSRNSTRLFGVRLAG